MRKLIYMVNTSLDGYIDGPGGAFDWATVGPEFSAFSEGLTDETDILLYGRVVYGWMASYWPTADQDQDAHPTTSPTRPSGGPGPRWSCRTP